MARRIMKVIRSILYVILSSFITFSTGVSDLADIDSGLVGYWSFDEGVSDTAYDYSGGGNHGSLHGAVWTEGIFGTALGFDGADDYKNIGVKP